MNDTPNCTTIEVSEVNPIYTNSPNTPTTELKTDNSRCFKCNEWHWFFWICWSLICLIACYMCFFFALPWYSFSDYVLSWSWNHYAQERVAVFMHITVGFWPMLLGVFQLCGPLRRKYISLHRWFGRIYVIFGAISIFCGLYMATNAAGGFATRLAFFMIGILWVLTTMIAVYYIRICKLNDKQFRIKHHRIWMMRSYAIMFGVATQRIWLPFFQFGLGYANDWRGDDLDKYSSQQEMDKIYIEFSSVYCASIWICLLTNICVCEGYLYVQNTYFNTKKS
eukprot:383988_1